MYRSGEGVASTEQRKRIELLSVIYNKIQDKSSKIMEVIEIIKASMTKEQFIGYCKGNSIKYRLRAGKKDDTLQDIAKAEEYEKFYLQLSNATDKDS